MKRRSLFSFLSIGFLTQISGQGQGTTQVNGGKQLKNIPVASDNWLTIIPAGVIDGVNSTFTLPIVPRKVEVFLNGLRQAQQAESPTNFDFSFSGSTITFKNASTPAVSANPDIILVSYTL